MAKETRDIHDFLKPQRGKVKQGYFTPQNPDKYKGDITKIIYRSSWELKFLVYCDNTMSIQYRKPPPVGDNDFQDTDFYAIQYYRTPSTEACADLIEYQVD